MPKLMIASGILLTTMAGVAAQTANTQPSGAAAPAVVYLVPEAPAPYSRMPYGYGPQGITPVPPDQVAQQYSCVIRLDSDADAANPIYGSSIDSQSAVALLTSTALIDPAAKQVLELTSQQRRELVVVNVYPAGSRLARVEVILRKADRQEYEQDAAAKLMNVLISRLKSAYMASSNAARDLAGARRSTLEAQLKAAETRLDELRHLEHETRVKAALANINPQADVASQIGNLQMQRRNLQGELSRNRARLQSLETGSAPLVAQWTEIVSFREKRLDELKKSTADHPAIAEQVQEATADLAEAKAQLEQAKNLPNDQAGGGAGNARFRGNELANLRASIAEQDDRLKQFDDQLSKLQDPQFLALMEQFPQVQGKQMPLRNQISELQGRLDQLRRAGQGEGSMSITVLDGSGR